MISVSATSHHHHQHHIITIIISTIIILTSIITIIMTIMTTTNSMRMKGMLLSSLPHHSLSHYCTVTMVIKKKVFQFAQFCLPYGGIHVCMEVLKASNVFGWHHGHNHDTQPLYVLSGGKMLACFRLEENLRQTTRTTITVRTPMTMFMMFMVKCDVMGNGAGNYGWLHTQKPQVQTGRRQAHHSTLSSSTSSS